MKTTWSAVWRLALSLGVSLVILGLVFHLVGQGSDRVSTAQLLDVLRKVSFPLTLAALGLAGWFLVSVSLPGRLLTAIVALALVIVIMAAALVWGVRQNAVWCAR